MNQDTSNEEFYSEDKYLESHPCAHIEDSDWKLTKIIPLIDVAMETDEIRNSKSVTVLDVGGGAGLILREVSEHIEKKYKVAVRKIALDLSPGMLKMQKEANPDLFEALNENIEKTSIEDHQIDITLMIDVLEHVEHPDAVLKELRRISKFTLFKVPLEVCFMNSIYNALTGSKQRRISFESFGHVNYYTDRSLLRQIQDSGANIVRSTFTDAFHYFSETKKNSGKINKLYLLASMTYKVSPQLAGIIWGDFLMVLSRSQCLRSS
jgi:ubiquinone/menaquinone biosynthesis C-methylase UbiE